MKPETKTQQGRKCLRKHETEAAIQASSVGTGDLAQWLRALVVKDQGSIPRTHLEGHHLLRHQTRMQYTDVHAGKRFILIK